MAYEGAAIWLYRRLRTAGAMDQLPIDVIDRLRAQAFEATARRMLVEAEAGESVALLRQAGISAILIKGVARSALAARYPWLDARASGDVDLLVELNRADDADQVLRAHGYRPAIDPTESIPGHHHLTPLRRGRVTVELHTSTSTRVPANVAWARANTGGETVSWAGQPVLVPHVTELAWGAIAHALEDELHGFRLSRFLEVAALAGAAAPVDWHLIHARIDANDEADPTIPGRDRLVFMRAWLDAAMNLGGAATETQRFDLRQLLAWRLTVLEHDGLLGRQLSERLIEEGPRSLIGIEPQRSPEGTSRMARWRRSAAARVSRALFGAWRMTP